MAYQVPQFIKEEVKLMGVINFTQLSILIGFFGIFGLLWISVQKWLCLLITLILAPFVFGITFGKIHDVYIYKLVGSMFRYIWLPKQYIWKKETSFSPQTQKTKKQLISSSSITQTKTLNKQTLKELSDILDR
jgi:hypothetical protein